MVKKRRSNKEPAIGGHQSEVDADADAAMDRAQILVTIDNTEGKAQVTYAIREVTGAVGPFGEELQTFYNNALITVDGYYGRLSGATGYTAYQPEIRKVLEYGVLKGDDFTFKLYEGKSVNKNKLIDTEWNDVTGRVAFEALTFGDDAVGKTFTYAIAEEVPKDAERTEDGKTVKDGIVYTHDLVRLTLKVVRDDEGNIEVQDTYEQVSDGSVTKTDDPTLVNSLDIIIVRAHKYSREDLAKNKKTPLAGAHYGLWMVNPGGADIYLGEGRNRQGIEGCSYESAVDGSLFYDLPMVEGVAYYLKEQGASPAGHLIDPYPTDYFTLVRDEDGYRLVYESDFGSTEEFLAFVRRVES